MSMSDKKLDNVGVVILAAGKGTRLGCVDIPKVMLEIGGRPIVSYIVETLQKMGCSSEQICLVVGFKQEKVREYFGDSVTYAYQEEQKGTAHAAYTGMKQLPSSIEHVLVLGGDDSAFYTPTTLEHFIEQHISKQVTLSLLSAEVEHPEQLGRIVRHENGDIEIIEKEYVTEEQKKIKEVSTGTYCFDRKWFENIFPTMSPLRKLGEYALPTTLAVARQEKKSYQIVKLENNSEWFGVNTPDELEEARRKKNLTI